MFGGSTAGTSFVAQEIHYRFQIPSCLEFRFDYFRRSSGKLIAWGENLTRRVSGKTCPYPHQHNVSGEYRIRREWFRDGWLQVPSFRGSCQVGRRAARLPNIPLHSPDHVHSEGLLGDEDSNPSQELGDRRCILSQILWKVPNARHRVEDWIMQV